MTPSPQSSSSITVVLPALSAAVMLEALLEEHARDNSRGELYTRKWHRAQIIEAVREALVQR